MQGELTESIIISGKSFRLYRSLANVKMLPRFLDYIKNVFRTGEHSSHWVVRDTRGNTMEWDTEITRLDRNKRIAWHSGDGGPMKTSGQITFNPMPYHQTEVTVMCKYVLREGEYDAADAERALHSGLRKLKKFVEKR